MPPLQSLFPSQKQDCLQVGVEIYDVEPPVMKKPVSIIPDKLLAIMRKYKYNWRIDQLSHPKYRTAKFIPKKVELFKPTKPKQQKISAESKFFSDHMARPKLRILLDNKKLFTPLNGRRYRRAINRNIQRTWDSIYNYYKKNLREKSLRQRQRDAKLNPKKKKKKDTDRINEIAKPKPDFSKKPPTDEKPKTIFKNFDHLETLAAPKEYHISPPRILGVVEPSALTYEATENVLKLAQIPERLKNIPPPVELGVVKKSALRYKATERILALAEPKKKAEKQKIEEDFDPFAISKNALKYKATPRIIELAKPLERE